MTQEKQDSILKNITSIKDLDIEGKSVFIRVDFNVPIKDGKIQDDFRIRAALPTLNWAVQHKAKIILATHLGRPQSFYEEKFSIKPVAEFLGQLMGKEVLVIEDPEGASPLILLKSLKPSQQLIFLENLRFSKYETKNDVRLAEKIASYTDIYINDAFGASHRAHSSIVGLPKLIKNCGSGLLLEKEIRELEKVLKADQRPFALILGGAKVSDKIRLLETLSDKADMIFIGGAMAYTFLKAQEQSVGSSLVDKHSLTFAKNFLKRMKLRDKKVFLPIDHKVIPELNSLECEVSDHIAEGSVAGDIGPKTLKMFEEELKKVKMIFWNGPMGIFEHPSLKEGTLGVSKILTQVPAYTVVGGGDSVHALQDFKLLSSIDHISTGGGASLEFLQGEPLPGIKALKQQFF